MLAFVAVAVLILLVVIVVIGCRCFTILLFSAGLLANSVVIYICDHFTLSYRLVSYFCTVVFIVLVFRLLF